MSKQEKVFDIVDSVEDSIMSVFYQKHCDIPLNYLMVACERLAARMASDIGVNPSDYVKCSEQMIKQVQREKKENSDEAFSEY
tara:strand:- start:3237 stop:3485 length:249 start_codon:yes stop_codon:yes gene_type:complete